MAKKGSLGNPSFDYPDIRRLIKSFVKKQLNAGCKSRDIKEGLNKVVFEGYHNAIDESCEALTLLNKLESQNKSLTRHAEILGYANDELIKRNERLEKALFDMVVQFCQTDKEGHLHHTYMSADEKAFDILGIKYGEKVDDVRKKLSLRWWEEL